jgi:hypothetical protein
VLVLAAAVAGCSGGGSLPPAHSRSAAAPPPFSRPSSRPLSVRLVLPARTLPGGSHMTGRVLVRNRTGHALHLTGCVGFFQVALASRTYHPEAAWLACAQRLTIPAGVYHTQFFQDRPLAAPPAPLTVRVTAPWRTR